MCATSDVHENLQIVVTTFDTRRATVDDFDVRVSPLPTLARGDVLVRAMYVSIDPWLSAVMRDRTLIPQGSVVPADVVGRVVESTHAFFRDGDIVQGPLGWQRYSAAPGFLLRKIDRDVAPVSVALGILGTTGLTAYVGLFAVGRIRPHEVVIVSAAAGGVGSTAAQLAHAAGCRVIGIAGSADKVRFLVHDLGVDAAFNYNESDWARELSRCCPFGADLYFDNVGGRVSDAILPVMKRRGRIILCGQIAAYDRAAPPRTPWYAVAHAKQLRVEGFVVTDFQNLFPHALQHLTMCWRAGLLRPRETVSHGIERAPEAFISMLRGGNIGKQLVKVD